MSGTKIKEKLYSHYELKYSKSKNVYTLYYLESYIASDIASDIDNIDKLLNQQVYEQGLLSLEKYPVEKVINGIKVVDSISILDDKYKLNLVKKSILQ